MSLWLARSRFFARRGAMAGASALLILCVCGIVVQWFTYNGPDAPTFWGIFAYFLWVLPVSGVTAAIAVVAGNRILLLRQSRPMSSKTAAVVWTIVVILGAAVALLLRSRPLDTIVAGTAILAGGLIAIFWHVTPAELSAAHIGQQHSIEAD